MKTMMMMLTMAALLCGCGEKGAGKSPDPSVQEQLAERAEYRRMYAEYVVQWTQSKKDDEHKIHSLKEKLGEETAAGKVELLRMDMEKAGRQLAISEKNLKKNYRALMDLDLGDPFKGVEGPVDEDEPDYSPAISEFTQALHQAMNEDLRGVDDGWRERQAEWHRLLRLELDAVMEEFGD